MMMPQHPNKQQMIVGVVGPAASGKNTVADMFAQQGYMHISSSDKVREEIAARGLTASRELQTAVANELRTTAGLGYWVDRSVVAAPDGCKRIVVSGLYSVGEGIHLQKRLGGFLVGVTTGEVDNPQARYQKLAARAEGDRDNMSQQEFMAAHARENCGTKLHETNVAQLVAMADYTIVNSHTLEHLQQQVTAVIQNIEGIA